MSVQMARVAPEASHANNKFATAVRPVVEFAVLVGTLVLGVFTLHGSWNLFQVGALYPAHFLAYAFELLHGSDCVALDETRLKKVQDGTDAQAMGQGRVCLSATLAALGACLADVLVLGQGSRELHDHKATTEYTQLVLVCVLLGCSLWRLGLTSRPHWKHREALRHSLDARPVSDESVPLPTRR